ncbi:MAG TPA: glycosyltransferase family 2 protein [Pyrinomonadaceae bacterium]|jgi:glycosyltransferase involved in cell wall biosynthesis
MTDENVRCLSVVVPAYNEETTLASVVQKLLTLSHLLEVVIVDDCSTDRTPEIADELARSSSRVKFTRHEKNAGKTEALKTGFAMTRGDIVIVQDADLENDPAEIPAVIKPILEGQADVVYGSRFLAPQATRVFFFYAYLANMFLTFVSNLLTNLRMTDVETAYKAFRGEIIRNLIIKSSGFGFEVEVTAKVAKLRCAIYEVPISYHCRTYKEGKKIGVRDGLQAVWLIFRFNLFCRLKSSFRTIPDISSRQRLYRTDKPQLADEPETSQGRLSATGDSTSVSGA